MLLVATLGCDSLTKPQAEFRWGESLKEVQQRENRRLKTQPKGIYTQPNGLKILTYYDRFMGAQCVTGYWFDMDSLQFVSYSCSNPDWDEKELQNQVSNKLRELYGESQQVQIGAKQYQRYLAPRGMVYFSMIRIAQNREFWRTFQANIFLAHFPHEDYAPLAATLSSFGSAEF